MIEPTAPSVLSLLVRHAPVIPEAVLEAALRRAGQDTAAAGVLLSALLSRPDVPLGVLAPHCPVPHPRPELAAAWLTRPEHTPDDLAALVAAEDRHTVHAKVFTQPATGQARAARAVLAACAEPECLLAAVRSTTLEEGLRAEAVERLLAVAAALGGRGEEEVRQELLAWLERPTRSLANALALRVSDPDVLAAVVHRVSDPDAVDRLVRVLLHPALRVPDLSADRVRQLLAASNRLWEAGMRPATAATLATWWSRAELGGTQEHARRLVGALVARLTPAEPVDQPWFHATQRGGDRARLVALAAHLVAELGEDADAWEVLLGLSPDFTGTTGQLLAAARAVAAGPDAGVAAPAPAGTVGG